MRFRAVREEPETCSEDDGFALVELLFFGALRRGKKG